MKTLHQDPLLKQQMNNSASRPSSETVTGSTPDPVRPELPSNDPSFVCRSVSSWDEVTETSGDVFCTYPNDPPPPSSQEPIIGCTGIVTSQVQLDSVRDCTVLYGSIDFYYSTITVINLPLLERITGQVFLYETNRLTDLLVPALTSIEGSSYSSL